ncbi:MAG: DUF362 domain-containing protein [Bacilli bacterium]|nr:DUF362 domain-containing protein [Bacilli bacterium]
MEKAKVYFTDMRADYGNNLLEKLQNLMEKSNLSEIDFKDKFVALKIHFGEYGNLAFIRPNYVKVVADYIKSKGGIPFLTDASTLYSGTRSDAISHLHTAALNGFNGITTGCPVIIADGLKGNDYKEVEVNLKHCSTVKIGTAIMEADIIISLSHFKGHEQAGFGGTLKNIGMGCGSKLGKLEMHSGIKPEIDESKCIACGMCVKHCNQKAIHMDKKAIIDYHKCVGCGECIVVCSQKAIFQGEETSSKILNEKIVEYTYGVLKDKPHHHINFIMNVSPNCDCWGMNDMAIVPDIGMMISSDPVAIDMASADLVNAAPTIISSVLGDKKSTNDDKFKCIHGNVDWESGLDYAEELKMGTKEYELIK